MPSLADQIRAHLAQDGNFAKGTAANTALLAIVEKCEQLHSDNRDNARQFAREFESVIAQSLGIEI